MAVACVGAGSNAWVDPEGGAHNGDYDDVAFTTERLVDLSSQCAFNETTKILTLQLSAGDQAIIGKSTDDRITINYIQCGTATKANTKRILVTQDTGSMGDQTVYVDYGNGTFALGAGSVSGIDLQLGGESGDELLVLGTTGNDTVTVGSTGIITNGDSSKDITYTGVSSLTVSTGSGNDNISARGSTATGAAVTLGITISGGAGNDTIRGGDGADTLNGGADNDVFITASIDDGGDIFSGGGGTDTVSYSGQPTVATATNIPSAAGTTGLRTASITVDLGADGDNDDGLSGEMDEVRNDIEVVFGGSGDDTLTGSAGAQTLYGGAGADSLEGGDDADVLYGDAGNDTIDEGTASNGGDVINCGAGVDLVDYSGRTANLTVTMDGVAADDGAASEGDNVKSDCDNIVGGTMIDNFTGNALANEISGANGADTLNGGDGSDTLIGGASADVMSGGNGDDIFDEGAASSGGDTIVGGAGRDTVDYSERGAAVTVTFDGMSTSGASGENDNLATDMERAIGGSAGDTMTGTAANEALEGGDGADTLDAGGGDDIIEGGSNTDVITCGSGDGDICIDAEGDCDATCEIVG